MKENHLKLIQHSMLRPSYYLYRQIWCGNFLNASLKCRLTQTYKWCVIWSSSVFPSFENYITGENITRRKSVKSNVSISCDLQCNCWHSSTTPLSLSLICIIKAKDICKQFKFSVFYIAFSPKLKLLMFCKQNYVLE